MINDWQELLLCEPLRSFLVEKKRIVVTAAKGVFVANSLLFLSLLLLLLLLLLQLSLLFCVTNRERQNNQRLRRTRRRNESGFQEVRSYLLQRTPSSFIRVDVHNIEDIREDFFESVRCRRDGRGRKAMEWSLIRSSWQEIRTDKTNSIVRLSNDDDRFVELIDEMVQSAVYSYRFDWKCTKYSVGFWWFSKHIHCQSMEFGQSSNSFVPFCWR